MKNYLFLLLICISQNITSQTADKKIKTEEPVLNATEIQQRPVFVGGTQQLYNFIGKTIKFPDGDMATSVKVIVSFIVEIDGSLTDIKVVENSGEEAFATEAKRVMQLSPKWICGQNNGQKVRSIIKIPIGMVKGH